LREAADAARAEWLDGAVRAYAGRWLRATRAAKARQLAAGERAIQVGTAPLSRDQRSNI
jgi:hypothetical protein